MRLPRSLSLPTLLERPPPRPTAPPERAPAPGQPEPEPKPCRCGHDSRAHQHYRKGTDCALCACPRFRSAKPFLRRGLRGERPGTA